MANSKSFGYNQIKRQRRVPECGHPERKHFARGMCDPCYNSWLSKKKTSAAGSGAIEKAPGEKVNVPALTQESANELTDGAFATWAERRCPVCRAPIVRWAGEPDDAFAHRLCCDTLCEILGLALSSQWRQLFPGAQYRTRREVPERCQCGGPWRETRDGVACLVCSRSAAVAQYLVQSVLFSRRSQDRRDDEEGEE